MDISSNPNKKLEIEVDGKIWIRLPIKTDLILPKSAYPEIYKAALEKIKFILEKDDIVFAGEKAIAVAEERAWHKNEIKVNALAKLLVRFVTKTPTGVGISSPETFQLALNEVGPMRIIISAIIGGIAKSFGIRGVFYRIAGRQVAMIDGAADYVIPPYNEYCSLGPKDPSLSARRIAESLGVKVVVVDANDFGVEVVGKSHPDIDTKLIKRILKDNPLGQSSEQTPLGIIRFKKN